MKATIGHPGCFLGAAIRHLAVFWVQPSAIPEGGMGWPNGQNARAIGNQKAAKRPAIGNQKSKNHQGLGKEVERGFWVDNRAEHPSGVCFGPRRSWDTFLDFHEQDFMAMSRIGDRSPIRDFVLSSHRQCHS